MSKKENIWNILHQQNRSGNAADSWRLEIFAVTANNQSFIVFLKAPIVCNSNKTQNWMGSGSKYFQTSAVSSTPTSVLLMQNILNVSILDILFYAVVKQRSKSAKKKVTPEKMREEKY